MNQNINANTNLNINIEISTTTHKITIYVTIKNMKHSAIVFLLLIISYSSFAQPILPDEEPTIEEIDIADEYRDYNIAAEGLPISQIEIPKPKRSKVAFIRLISSAKVGDIYTKKFHADTYVSLWKAGLFKIIGIIPTILSDNTVLLTIAVEDKWTLLPIPYFAITSGGYLFGAAFVESNLFGWGKTLVATGGYSNTRYYGTLIYSDKQFLNRRFILTVLNTFTVTQYTDTTYGSANIYFNDSERVNTIIRKSEGLFFMSSIKFGYAFENNITPHTKLAFYSFDNSISHSEEFEATSNKLDSSWGIPATLGVEYKNTLPYGVLEKGFTGFLAYTLSPINSAGVEFFNYTESNLKYALGVDKKGINLFIFYLDGYYGNTPINYAARIGRTDTTRSIAQGSIRTNKYVASAIEHIITVYKNKKIGIIINYGGDLSYYQLADYSKIDTPLLNGGIFVGTGLVLKEVAIPVLSVFTTYNPFAEYMTFGFSFGVR